MCISTIRRLPVVADSVFEPGDIENMDVGVGILFLAVLSGEIVLLPVLAAVTCFRYNVTFGDIENMGIAAGILLLRALELEIMM